MAVAVAVALVYILRREYYILRRSIFCVGVSVCTIFYFYLTYRRHDVLEAAHILSRHPYGGCKRSKGPLSHGHCCCINQILRRCTFIFREVSFGGRQKSFSGGIKGEGNSDDRGVNGG